MSGFAAPSFCFAAPVYGGAARLRHGTFAAPAGAAAALQAFEKTNKFLRHLFSAAKVPHLKKCNEINGSSLRHLSPLKGTVRVPQHGPAAGLLAALLPHNLRVENKQRPRSGSCWETGREELTTAAGLTEGAGACKLCLARTPLRAWEL